MGDAVLLAIRHEQAGIVRQLDQTEKSRRGKTAAITAQEALLRSPKNDNIAGGAGYASDHIVDITARLRPAT